MNIDTILTFLRKFFKIGSIVTILLIIILLVFFIKYSTNLEHKIATYKENEKAFLIELDSTKLQNRRLQLTVDELDMMNDSITWKMNELRKLLNIKDKNLVSMQYLLSTAHSSDTIIYNDTIFAISVLHKDTVISNEWYTLKLDLDYPNKITVSPTFKSEKYIVVSNKKETINPPKKFFLWRWFQKKHIVANIDVIEKSPYIDNKKYRYIEIIK